ncbi:formate dehydrogenase accessory sulfurtransferase FdhD [Nocardia sp. ET3-3]|uniref:Sulfur carrier protein FdhD n=1 Tax=Nocardia terrae TaxID=2675851 RepID=A0A7K1V288_9NOCA|nr:formate dehydrogenase accessory sulfurtransferase FdhD [Nocardia terrae]MVU80753.1 formate dehydrogenase accessory sulfurtransferase FdhD [Nocardia terrae]
MGRITTRVSVNHIRGAGRRRNLDNVVVEQPMELRLNGEPIAVTMRTPGADFELAQGFLLTEGVIGGRDDVRTVRYCGGASDGVNSYNVVDVALAQHVPVPDLSLDRNFYMSSSCGVCGKASMDAVRLRTRFPLVGDVLGISATTLAQLPDLLRSQQKCFDSTGGLHAAGLFDLDGAPLVVREDVGRHNAVDKVVGWALQRDRLPLSETVLLVSGRASFELVQKAVMSGIPMLAAVSAPSSLAIELAREAGLTLIGFLRGETMNVYAHGERVC